MSDDILPPAMPGSGELEALEALVASNDTAAPIIPRGLAQQHVSAALNRLADAFLECEKICMAVASGLDASAEVDR